MRLCRMLPRLSIVAMSVLPSLSSFADGDEMKTQGRWSYSEGGRTLEGRKSWIATIQADEANEVWLSFWCSDDDRTVFASIYDSRGVAPKSSDVEVEVTLQSGATFGSPLQLETGQVGVFPAALSERLFLYAVHAEILKVAVPNQHQTRDVYTFMLQPNDLAMKAIINGCVSKRGTWAPTP